MVSSIGRRISHLLYYRRKRTINDYALQLTLYLIYHYQLAFHLLRFYMWKMYLGNPHLSDSEWVLMGIRYGLNRGVSQGTPVSANWNCVTANDQLMILTIISWKRLSLAELQVHLKMFLWLLCNQIFLK